VLTLIEAKVISPHRLAEVEMAKSILVADDNPKIRAEVCRLFESEEHYKVCAEAGDGQEAIDRALKHRPDLIVLDLSMPLRNGFEVARELKRLMPDVPIILFTQHADLGKHLLGSIASVDRVVSKSEPLELMKNVRALLPI
jgi:CheY-like chemotaxis protein